MIRSPGMRMAATLFGLLAALGCNVSQHPQAAEEGSPGAAVQAFYNRLAEGDYSGAQALYSAEARDIVADPDVFRTWADQATHQGAVDGVAIVDTQIPADGNATVLFDVVYNDGTKQSFSVGLTDEGGSWHLGMIVPQ